MIRMDVTGHIGQDAIVRDVAGQNQKAVNFSVAHTEKYKDVQGVQHEKVTWVNCTYWRPSDRLGIVQYLTKGTRVFVSGQPSAVGYVPQNGGAVRGDLRLTVNFLELLGAANNNPQQGSFNGGQQQAAQQRPPMAGASDISPDDEDSLPF